jgi:hypothetical protein
VTHQRAIPTRIVAVLGAVGIAAAVLASGCAYDRLAAADQADQAAAAIEAPALASSVAKEIQRELGLAASVAATGAD